MPDTTQEHDGGGVFLTSEGYVPPKAPPPPPIPIHDKHEQKGPPIESAMPAVASACGNNGLRQLVGTEPTTAK